MRVEDLLDISFFSAHPEEFYSWARDVFYNLDDKEPNIVHKVLAKLEAMGRLSEGIFTQNIDSMHQRAGSKKVYELHGTLGRGYCMRCNSYYDYKEIAAMVRSGMVPVCKDCGGVIKPDIVFYGENLDMSILKRAEISLSRADLLLVLGSSLVVNPAASLPMFTYQNGGKIVLVNRDSTYLDDKALRFNDLESFFSEFDAYLNK